MAQTLISRISSTAWLLLQSAHTVPNASHSHKKISKLKTTEQHRRMSSPAWHQEKKKAEQSSCSGVCVRPATAGLNQVMHNVVLNLSRKGPQTANASACEGPAAPGEWWRLPSSPNLHPLCIDFSPLMKIHHIAVLASRFCVSVAGGRGTNTLSSARSASTLPWRSSRSGAWGGGGILGWPRVETWSSTIAGCGAWIVGCNGSFLLLFWCR